MEKWMYENLMTHTDSSVFQAEYGTNKNKT